MNLDYSSLSHYALALLPEVVLSVWAMLVLMIDVFQKGERGGASSPIIGWLTMGGLALAAGANVLLLNFTEPSAAGMMALDSFRVFTNFLFLGAAALFVLIGARYLEEENLRLGELYVLVMLATVGMMIFAGSRDLMVIFLGLEMTSVPVYVLTGVKRRDRRSAEGALKYFLLGAFSSAFFLFGVALVYGGTGSTNLPQIAAAIGVDGVGSNNLVLLGMAMLIIGFGFKVAAVPFHMWTPDAYEGAPAPITAFMAAAVKAAAFAAFLRVFIGGLGGLADHWSQMVFWLAAITMVAANLIALVENNVKRMLAYSSIAHAGYLLVALASASQRGAASYLYYLVVYTLMTIGAFAVVIAVGRAGEERLDLEAYSGLAWEKPFIGIVMTIFLLSLAGFPFTGGFIGKVFILQAAVETGLVPLAIVLVLASLISYWYYLRVAWYMWFREGPAKPAALLGTPAMRERLLAQLRQQHRENTLEYRIVSSHFEQLVNHRWSEITAAQSASPQEVQHAADEIAKLDPGPAVKSAVPALSPVFVPGPMKVALVVAAVGIVLLGVLPGELLDAAERSAAGLMPSTTAGAAGGMSVGR